MIINCTPHDVAIYSSADCYMYNGSLYLREGYEGYTEPLRVYPAAKEPARVTLVQELAGVADGIPIYWWAPDEFVNLPDESGHDYYIVSKIVAQAWPAQENLIFPGTVVRDADGHIVGYVDFSRV